MARRAHPAPHEESIPGWFVTFADLMTLLMTFFVLLLSMSTVDKEKVGLAVGSLRGALGVLDGGAEPREGRKELAQMPLLAQGAAQLMTTLGRIVERENVRASNDFIQIGHKDEKIVIAIDDGLLFAPGSTEVLPSAYRFLDDLAATLVDGSAVAEFIGHADDSRPAGFYDSNWEVAAARALSVLQYVAASGPVPGRRLKASSHGEFLPLHTNDSPGARAKNRRVEILLTVTSASDRYFYGESRELRAIPDEVAHPAPEEP